MNDTRGLNPLPTLVKHWLRKSWHPALYTQGLGEMSQLDPARILAGSLLPAQGEVSLCYHPTLATAEAGAARCCAALSGVK